MFLGKLGWVYNPTREKQIYKNMTGRNYNVNTARSSKLTLFSSLLVSLPSFLSNLKKNIM